MKVLTATTTGQGDRPGDFSWTVEGELVLLTDTCATDRADPDGGCGCGRAFAGTSSLRATTTVLVRDLDLTPDDVELAVAGWYENAGYAAYLEPDELAEAVSDSTVEVIQMASIWPAGSVLGRRLESVHVRTRGPGAGDLDHLFDSGRRGPGRPR